jgi:hypothetical protein
MGRKSHTWAPLNYLMRIRDGKKCGSGINIPDPHSATLSTNNKKHMDLPRDNRGNGFLLMLYGDVGGGCGSHGARLPGRGIRGEHELRRHPVREGRQTKVSLRNKETHFLNIFSEHLESGIFRNLSATECKFISGGTETDCRIRNLRLWNLLLIQPVVDKLPRT